MEEMKSVEEVKAGAELGLEAFVEKAYEPVVDELLKKLAEVIPGKIDDAVIDMAGPSLKIAAKAALLAQIEKISDKV